MMNKVVVVALGPWRLLCTGLSEKGTRLLDGGRDQEHGLPQAIIYDIDAKVRTYPSSDSAHFASVGKDSCPLEAKIPGLFSNSSATRQAQQQVDFPEADGFRSG